MKKSNGSMFLLFVLLTVLATSGCTTSQIPEPISTTPSTLNATIPPKITATNVQQRVNATTSGTISANETWSNEIHITGDIFFSKGVKLTIEPGTTVYLASNNDDQHIGGTFDDAYTRDHNDPVRLGEWESNAIVIDGRNGIIHAVGSPEQPITFRPEGDSTSPAQWDGIYFEQGTLQHAIVLYGGRTAVQVLGAPYRVEIAYNQIRYFHWVGIDANKSNVWIHHNIVEGGGHQGIGAREDALVENNVISLSQNGIGVERGNGTMIQNNLIIDCANGVQIREGKDISIINNTIVWVNGSPDGWKYQDTLIYPAFKDKSGVENHIQTPDIKILNNIIFGAMDRGIALLIVPGDGSLIDYNLTWGQKWGLFNPDHPVVGSHNFDQDPLFADLANYDFSLMVNSLAIDAGIPDLLDADGSPSDLGAYGGPQGSNWTLLPQVGQR